MRIICGTLHRSSITDFWMGNGGTADTLLGRNHLCWLGVKPNHNGNGFLVDGSGCVIRLLHRMRVGLLNPCCIADSRGTLHVQISCSSSLLCPLWLDWNRGGRVYSRGRRGKRGRTIPLGLSWKQHGTRKGKGQLEQEEQIVEKNEEEAEEGLTIKTAPPDEQRKELLGRSRFSGG